MAFKVEIVDNELRITVPLESKTCALCKTVYEQVLEHIPDERTAFCTRTLSSFVCLPDWHLWEWVYANLSEPVLICPTCAAPIRAVKARKQSDVDLVCIDIAERLRVP